MSIKEYKKRVDACLDKLYSKGLAWGSPGVASSDTHEVLSGLPATIGHQGKEICTLLEESLEILKRRKK